MLLKISSMFFFMLFFTACMSRNPVDKRPVITICGLDIPSNIGNCGKTGQGVNTKTTPVSLDQLNKYFALSPDDFGAWKKYMDELELYARFSDLADKD